VASSAGVATIVVIVTDGAKVDVETELAVVGVVGFTAVRVARGRKSESAQDMHDRKTTKRMSETRNFIGYLFMINSTFSLCAHLL
jgi:hypothetical protein